MLCYKEPGGRIFAPIRLRRRGPHPDIVTIQYAPIHFFSPQPALAKPIRQRVVMKGVTPPTSADDHIATIPTFSQSVEGEDTNGAEEQQTQSPPYPKEFYVDVPMGVFPGESFRTSIADEEFLIVCPEIEEEGERIMVCISGGN